jgi:ribonuclease P protein subunit POP4
MDLHGAEVEVVRARDPGLVGLRGILIIETANTILVVTRNNRVVTVAKNVAVVRVDVGARSFEIALPLLPYRASERSARKVKKKHLALF